MMRSDEEPVATTDRDSNATIKVHVLHKKKNAAYYYLNKSCGPAEVPVAAAAEPWSCGAA